MKKILFSVLGMSPQILTETLYALNKEGGHLLPDEIFVLTTASGAELAKRAFFQEQGGWYFNFCRDWEVSNIRFDESHVMTLVDVNGDPLSDIRNERDNLIVADQITKFIEKFTSYPSASFVE